MSSLKTSTKDRETTSLLLARFGSKVRLSAADPTPGLKSVLKVTTLDESLRSCINCKKSASKRASLALESLGTSLRNLFGGGGGGGKPSAHTEDNGAGTGMDLILSPCRNCAMIQEEEEPTVTMGEHSSVEMLPNNNQKTKAVQFSTLERRLYAVAPSDNPAVTGLGPAIALDGWRYETERAQQVDTYEETRPPRKTLENLKLTMMDRQERLKEHGASAREMQLFAKRVKRAKTKRAETVEAFTLYGKQHLLREEKRENTKRWLQKLFRLRKHHAQEQVKLWEQAQQKQTQKQSAASRTTAASAATA